MSEKRPPPGDGDEHDPWLRQALQHAPDAAATPPSLLRETILAEARSAVGTARRAAGKPSGPSLLEQLDAFWSWLARPPVAAGFASVMAATIVGLMWWDRPMDEALPPPPASSSRVAAPVVAPPQLDVAPTPPSAAPTTTAPVVTGKVAAELSTRRDAPRPAPAAATDAQGARVGAPALKTAPVAQAEGSARKDRDVATREAEQKTPAPVAAPTTSKLAAAPAPFPASPQPAEVAAQGRIAPATAALEKSVDKKEAAPEARRAAAEPSTMMEAAKRADAPPAGAGVTNSVSAGKPASLARQRGATVAREAADSLDARAAANTPPAAFAPAPPPVRDEAAARERRVATADASARPMAPLLAALDAAGGHWARQGAGGESVAMDAASRAWLTSVDAAASTRWQSAPERTARFQGIVAADSRTMLLSLDEHTTAIVRIDDDGVAFAAPSGSVWFAALPADGVARLRATLPSPGR